MAGCSPSNPLVRITLKVVAALVISYCTAAMEKELSVDELMSNEERQCVFALTSTGNDLYSAMTRVAVASLRCTNPSIKVVVATDPNSYQRLRASGNPLLAEVDRVVEVPAPGYGAHANRFVKITLRQNIRGAFLFLDSDVLVRGDLSRLFLVGGDLAGARNHSLNEVSEQIYKRDAATLSALQWETRPDIYVNGGVLLYQDTEGAQKFSEEWLRRWKISVTRREDHRDQPALNAALKATEVELFQLPDQFNAQFQRNWRTLERGVIWHYYASGSTGKPNTRFEVMVKELMAGKRLDYLRVRDMINAPHPWLRNDFVGRGIFRRSHNRGELTPFRKAVLQRAIPGYCYRCLRSKAVRVLKQTGLKAERA